MIYKVVSVAFLTTVLAQPVFSQSNSVQLTIIGSCEPAPVWTGLWAWDVFVKGQYAYVAVNRTGLAVIDISDPTQPVRVGWLDTSYPCYLHGAGDYVYVGDHTGGLRTVDVRDPYNPLLVNTWQTVGLASGVYVRGDYAYVATRGWDTVPNTKHALEVLDVSDPVQPVRVGCYYTSSEPINVHVVGNYAYLARGALEVVDVSNPASPQPVAAFKSWLGYGRDVHVQGKYAYVGWTYVRGGLAIVDVTDPSNPVWVGGCDLRYFADRLDVVGTYAYVPTGPTMDVFDVHDPTQPMLAGTITLPDSARAVQVVGKFAYVASGRYFHVVEVGLPLRLNPPVCSGENICLSWNGDSGIRLQKATALEKPDWQDVPGSDGKSSMDLPMTGSAAFFRLVRQ